jgi:hypothetical protein
VVAAFAREFPGITYDVTIKIEHLLEHREHLSELGETGCAFVTSAVESVDDGLLAKLEKGHTRADFEQVAAEMRAAGLPLIPTFVAFTPWTSLQQYSDLVSTVDRLGLIEHVSPVQWSIRLLIREAHDCSNSRTSARWWIRSTRWRSRSPGDILTREWTPAAARRGDRRRCGRDAAARDCPCDCR